MPADARAGTQPSPGVACPAGVRRRTGHWLHRVALLACAALALFRLPCAVAVDATLWLVHATPADPIAVCNDGSPGGFYFQAASDAAQAHLWVVYLQGGMWCWDQESCLTRQQETAFFTSSTNWPTSLTLGGIFDSDRRRNPWSGANKIYLAYCSSDAWAGDVGAADNSFGFNFRGQRIIQATLALLVSNNGLGSQEGHRLLFGGCSAGSRGAMFNLDSVQAMVPSSVEVLGFLDSPLWVDMEPLSAKVVSLINETQAVYGLVNATARLGPLCVAAYPEAADQWKCLFGQYRLPFLTTRYLLSASQFDKYQLPYNEDAAPPYSGSQLLYADNFQAAVRSVALNLPTPNQPGSAVFSSACFKHCTSDIGSFWGVKIDGVSLKDTLQAWYFPGTTPAPSQTIESCTGFGCGECHRPVADMPPQAPLPPAHTADLTVNAQGVGITVRAPPVPGALASLESSLGGSGGAPRRSGGGSRSGADSVAADLLRGAGACVLGVLLCAVLEFCSAARRNYTPPGGPSRSPPSSGGSSLISLGPGPHGSSEWRPDRGGQAAVRLEKHPPSFRPLAMPPPPRLVGAGAPGAPPPLPRLGSFPARSTATAAPAASPPASPPARGGGGATRATRAARAAAVASVGVSGEAEAPYPAMTSARGGRGVPGSAHGSRGAPRGPV